MFLHVCYAQGNNRPLLLCIKERSDVLYVVYGIFIVDIQSASDQQYKTFE